MKIEEISLHRASIELKKQIMELELELSIKRDYYQSISDMDAHTPSHLRFMKRNALMIEKEKLELAIKKIDLEGIEQQLKNIQHE